MHLIIGMCASVTAMHNHRVFVCYKFIQRKHTSSVQDLILLKPKQHSLGMGRKYHSFKYMLLYQSSVDGYLAVYCCLLARNKLGLSISKASLEYLWQQHLLQFCLEHRKYLLQFCRNIVKYWWLLCIFLNKCFH